MHRLNQAPDQLGRFGHERERMRTRQERRTATLRVAGTAS